MICTRFVFGCVLLILLVASVYGQTTMGAPSTHVMTTMKTSEVTSNVPTTASMTTARVTSQDSTGTTAVTSAPITTQAPTNATTTQSSSTNPVTVTTRESGRKFDGLSFVGGIILASGLAVLILLVVTYLRRTNRVPYSNLH